METTSYISPWLAPILKRIHPLFMWLYFRVTIKFPDHMPDHGPVILVPTHRTRWDTFFVHLLTKRYPRFLTSKDEFIGLQGWFMRRVGAFPINPRRPSTGSLKHCQELLLAGEPLVIFPEGRILRYPPDNVHPLKPGTAWLALTVQRRMVEAPIHIVPIRLNFQDRFLRFRSRVEVVVQDPIDVSTYLDLPKGEALASLTADIQRELGDIVNTSTLEQDSDRPISDEEAVEGEPAPAS